MTKGAEAYKTAAESRNDAAHLEEGVYVFELRRNGQVHTLIPLVVNPEFELLSEEFTVEVTPGARGAVFVEENGTVLRRLRLRGTTGLKLKPFPIAPTYSEAEKPAERSYNDRKLPLASTRELSGPAHFAILQDRIFRDYADFKRNPLTAKGTELYLHITKDQSVWRVIPEKFDVPRDINRRTVYNYDISLLLVAKGLGKSLSAPAIVAPATPAALTTAASLADQYRRELSRPWYDQMAKEVRDFTNKVLKAVNNAVRIVSDYVRGVISALGSITDSVKAAIVLIDSLVDTLETLFEDTLNLVATPLYLFRQLRNVFHSMVIQTQAIGRTAAGILQAYKGLAFSPSGSRSATSLQGLANQGNAGTGSNTNNLLSSSLGTQSVLILPNDTLQDLGARYSVSWETISVLNRLRPPYISLAGIPGTLRPGDFILIPQTEVEEPLNSLATMGVELTAPADELAYGRDLRLLEVTPRQFDWLINDSQDDFLSVVGVDNLEQGLNRRVRELARSSPFFPDLGIDALIGEVAEPEVQKIAFTRALEADPRVTNIEVKWVQDFDTTRIEATVRARSTSITISS